MISFAQWTINSCMKWRSASGKHCSYCYHRHNQIHVHMVNCTRYVANTSFISNRLFTVRFGNREGRAIVWACALLKIKSLSHPLRVTICSFIWRMRERKQEAPLRKIIVSSNQVYARCMKDGGCSEFQRLQLIKYTKWFRPQNIWSEWNLTLATMWTRLIATENKKFWGHNYCGYSGKSVWTSCRTRCE